MYIHIYIYICILGEHRPASYATTARDNGGPAESASTEYFSVEPLCHVCVCVTHLNRCKTSARYVLLFMTSAGGGSRAQSLPPTKTL